MPEENLQKMQPEELKQLEQKLKKEQTFSAFIIGITSGIAIYSMVVNGFNGKLIFLLLLPAYFLLRSRQSNAKLKQVRAQLRSTTP